MSGSVNTASGSDPARPVTVCSSCADTGHVCENHPRKPWGEIHMGPDGCDCGAGMPCQECCDPIPLDGTHSVTEAFQPWHLKAHKEGLPA